LAKDWVNLEGWDSSEKYCWKAKLFTIVLDQNTKAFEGFIVPNSCPYLLEHVLENGKTESE
jgi:hypothetical protein